MVPSCWHYFGRFWNLWKMRAEVGHCGRILGGVLCLTVTLVSLCFLVTWCTLPCSALPSPTWCEPSESLSQNKSFLTKVVCVRCSHSCVRGGAQEQSRHKCGLFLRPRPGWLCEESCQRRGSSGDCGSGAGRSLLVLPCGPLRLSCCGPCDSAPELAGPSCVRSVSEACLPSHVSELPP